MREESASHTFREVSCSLPLCSTLLTESSEEKTRHPAVVVSLTETKGTFSSRKRVVPGEAVAFILHPDLRYAVRGHVTWVRQVKDDVDISFGVAFEEEVPESLWEILGRAVAV